MAAFAVAGLSLNTYINSLSRLSVETARTTLLLDQMNFGGLTERAGALNAKTRELQATFSGWQVVKNVAVAGLTEIGEALDRNLGKLPSGFVSRFGTDQQAIAETRKAQAGVNEAIRQLVPSERAKIQTESDILGFQTTGAFAGLRSQEALGTLGDRPDITTFLDEMDRRMQALSNELTEKERQIQQLAEPVIAAARARGASPEEMAVIAERIQNARDALGMTTAFDVLRQQRGRGAQAIGAALSAVE